MAKAIGKGQFLFTLHQAQVILEPDQIVKVEKGKGKGNLLVLGEIIKNEAVFTEQVAYWKTKHGIELENETDHRIFMCHHFSTLACMGFQRTTILFSCEILLKTYQFPAAALRFATSDDLHQLTLA